MSVFKVDNSGVGEEFIVEVDGKYYIKHTQSAESIAAVLEQNQFERNYGNKGWGKSRELKKSKAIQFFARVLRKTWRLLAQVPALLLGLAILFKLFVYARRRLAGFVLATRL